MRVAASGVSHEVQAFVWFPGVLRPEEQGIVTLLNTDYAEGHEQS